MFTSIYLIISKFLCPELQDHIKALEIDQILSALGHQKQSSMFVHESELTFFQNILEKYMEVWEVL